MDRVFLVMRRRGWAGEIIDLIELKTQRESIDDVVLDARESRITQKGIEIVSLAGVKIVQRDNVISVPQKTFTQMRSQKSRTSGYQGAASVLVGAPLTAPGLQFQNLDELTHAFLSRTAHATARAGTKALPGHVLQNVANLRICGTAIIDVR